MSAKRSFIGTTIVAAVGGSIGTVATIALLSAAFARNAEFVGTGEVKVPAIEPIKTAESKSAVRGSSRGRTPTRNQ